jgi:branched-chain amino acid transport system permease protein
VTFGFVGTLGAEVLGLPLGFFLALVVGVAVVTHKVVYEPLGVGSIGLLITSIGIAFVYRTIVQLGFGTEFVEFQIPLLWPIEALLPFGIQMTLHDAAIVASAAVLVTGLHTLLQYTDLGRKMRATADNPSLARVSGIRTDRIEIWTWVIGADLAGAAGVFLGLYNNISPRMGVNILLVVFAAVILGGIGSVYGAMVGGFLIGMINQLTPILPRLGQELPFVPEGFGIPVGIEYANAIAFLIMVAVLPVRASGIAGEETT